MSQQKERVRRSRTRSVPRSSSQVKAQKPQISRALDGGGIALDEKAPDEKPFTQVKRSPIHGRGLFAARTIPKGTFLGIYEGERTMRDGCYVLWVENEARDDVYGVRGRNSLRFVNHNANPNAEFDGEELHSLRRIKPGEEITVHYGPEWDE